MLKNVVSKVLVVSNRAGKGHGFHATMWPAVLTPAIVLSISYQVPSPGLVQRICGIFNLVVFGLSAPDSFCAFANSSASDTQGPPGLPQR